MAGKRVLLFCRHVGIHHILAKSFQSKLEASSGITCNTVSLVDKYTNHEVLVDSYLLVLVLYERTDI